MPRKSKKSRDLTYRGVTYKSQFEVEVAKELYRIDKSKGKPSFKFSYEPDKITYVLENNYNPDFKIEKPNGETLYIEVKGLFDRADRRKMLAVKTQHPDIRVCILFLRDNKLDKRYDTRYSDWARKNGFEYAVGEIPDGWLE